MEIWIEYLYTIPNTYNLVLNGAWQCSTVGLVIVIIRCVKLYSTVLAGCVVLFSFLWVIGHSYVLSVTEEGTLRVQRSVSSSSSLSFVPPWQSLVLDCTGHLWEWLLSSKSLSSKISNFCALLDESEDIFRLNDILSLYTWYFPLINPGENHYSIITFLHQELGGKYNVKEPSGQSAGCH